MINQKINFLILKKNIKICKTKIKKLCLTQVITQMLMILILEVFKIDQNQKLYKIIQIEIYSKQWKISRISMPRPLRRILN